ncbi:MAG: DUF4290 domain-containing protein [Paludibacteraceae bacterium]|nr:DUF4290 domain-containing protein [Paludibacteraceae bacterium]
MEYPQQQGKLIMPEYGRNVQKMVAHALTISDREERNRCVDAILETMSNLFPYLKQEETYQQKIYDHLAVMSDFKLDIDWPYDKPVPEEIKLNPQKVDYPKAPAKMHYGRIVELMINNAIEETDTEKQHEKIITIANVMKRNLIVFNKDQDVSEQRIKNDIRDLSGNRLNTDFESFRLFETNELVQDSKKQKKNKK